MKKDRVDDLGGISWCECVAMLALYMRVVSLSFSLSLSPRVSQRVYVCVCVAG